MDKQLLVGIQSETASRLHLAQRLFSTIVGSTPVVCKNLKPFWILLKELEEAVDEAFSSAGGTDEGMAPMYGMNAKMPDRSIVGEYLTAYQDALLSI